MMDPIAALGLACNVLQLVEQAIHAAAACKQIYDNGSLPENDSIEGFVAQVAAANSELKTELVNTKQSPRDARLRALAQDATKTADELKLILGKIKYVKQQKGTTRAIQQSLRTLLARGKIEKLQSQLTEHEARLQSGLLKDLYIRCVKNESTNAHLYAQLSKSQQDMIRKVADNNRTLSNDITDKIEATSAELTARSVQHTDEILSAVDIAKDAVLESQALQRLLESLHFADMCQRQNDIAKRVDDFGETFQWILHPTERKKHTFVGWLREGSGIFWINGKPGSGKSTVVDFLQQQLQNNADTTAGRHLRHWAAPEQPVVVSFFIYSATTSRLQGSFEGLWRSLCHQLLSQIPSLVRHMAQDVNAPSSLQFRASASTFALTTWLLRDLKSTFFYLLQESLTQRKVFILLDGLDEFQDDQEQLVRHLQSLMRISDGLKICCASRPESLFTALLDHYPTLKLQDFTYDDISDHCQRTLKDTTASFLSERVATLSDGVFLWAYVVSSDLLRGARCDATGEELGERLRQLPIGMTSLFSHMISKIDPFYLKNPLPYLNIFLHCTDCTLLELIMAVFSQKTLNTMAENGVDEIMTKEIDQKCKDSIGGIVARCGGLVELYFDRENSDTSDDCSSSSPHVNIRKARHCRVGLIHRTAKDFLLEIQEGQRFISRHTVSYHEALLRIAKARLGTIHLYQVAHLRGPKWSCLVSHAKDITRFIDAVALLSQVGGVFTEVSWLLDESQKILNVVIPMDQGLGSWVFYHSLPPRLLKPKISYAQNVFFDALVQQPGLHDYITKKLLETPPSVRSVLATSTFLLCMLRTNFVDEMRFSSLALNVLDYYCDPNIETELHEVDLEDWSIPGVMSLWARFLVFCIKKKRRVSRPPARSSLSHIPWKSIEQKHLADIADRFLLNGADAGLIVQVQTNISIEGLFGMFFMTNTCVRVENLSRRPNEESAPIKECAYITEWDVPNALSLIQHRSSVLDATLTSLSRTTGHTVVRKVSPLGTERFLNTSPKQSSELYRPYRNTRRMVVSGKLSLRLIADFFLHWKIILANKTLMKSSDIEALQRYGWNLESEGHDFLREGPSELRDLTGSLQIRILRSDDEPMI